MGVGRHKSSAVDFDSTIKKIDDHMAAEEYKSAIELGCPLLTEVNLKSKNSARKKQLVIAISARLAKSYMLLGENKLAIQYYQQELDQLDSSKQGEMYYKHSGFILCNIANANKYLGNLEEAVTYFESALKRLVHVGGVSDRVASANYELGKIYFSQKKMELARRCYDTAVALDPYNVNYLPAVFEFYKANSLYPEVKKVLKNILSLPKAAQATFDMDNIYVEMMQLACAVPELFSFKEVRLYAILKKDNAVIQDLYNKYAANFYVNNTTKDYDAAYPHVLALSQSSDASHQFKGYSNLLEIALHRENYLLVKSHAKSILEVYKQNESVLSAHKKQVSNIVHLLARGYDEEDVFNDPLEAFKYYQIAGNLGNARAFHDMAYKYQVGEGVRRDVYKAIKYFKKSVMLDPPVSLFNLFRLQVEFKQDLSETLKILEQQKTAKSFYVLGTYYFQLSNPNIFEEDVSSEDGQQTCVISGSNLNAHWDSENMQTAIHYFESAVKIGDACSNHNLGVIYHLGLGVPKNLALAHQNYSVAFDAGNKLTPPMLELLLHDLQEVSSQTQDAAVVEVVAEEDKAKEKRESEENKLKQAIAADKISSISEYYQENTEKISSLLKLDSDAMDIQNLISVLHSIGCATEKSLLNRDFHHRVLPEVLAIIEKISSKLPGSTLTPWLMCSLAKGLSKLRLSNEVDVVNAAIRDLYQQVLAKIEEFNTPENLPFLINIIYSSIRFDQHEIFNVIIPTLITFVVNHFQWGRPQDAANFIYALAVFDGSRTLHISVQDFEKMGLTAMKHFRLLASVGEEKSEDRHVDEMNEDVEAILLHQIYSAFYYMLNSGKGCDNKKIQEACQKLSMFLENYKGNLHDVHVSNLQRSVVRFVKGYVANVKEEVEFNTFSVDAVVKLLDGMRFILQVNGPTHYIHDQNRNPKASKQDLFRNLMNEIASGLKVIVVGYHEWQTKFERSEKHIYLSHLLRPHNLIFPAAKLPELGVGSWRNNGASSLSSSSRSDQVNWRSRESESERPSLC